MRVLICSNAYPPNIVGGAELMAHEQAKALGRLGHEVHVFAGELNPAKKRYARDDEVHEGIRVHRIVLAPEDYSPEFLNFVHPAVEGHFRDILNDFQPEVVHFHNISGLSVKLPIMARWHGAGTVCTLHDFWGFCLRNTAVRPDGQPCHNVTQCASCLPRIHDGRKLHVPLRFRKDFVEFALDQVDWFIAPSRHVAQRYVLAGMSAERLRVIPNGVDIDRFRPASHVSSQRPVRITYAGYFGAHKGVATLLEAVARLPALLPKDRFATVQLAGEGPEKNALLARVRALGLQDRVEILGKVAPSEMPSVYARTDIVVLPSVWGENQPVSLMEAMAAGLPVVASRMGGVPELIAHGVNGLMFVAGDAGDLAAQLARLIGDPHLRRRAGQEGRRRVERLTHDGQVQHLVEVYESTAGLSRALVQVRQLYVVVGSLRRRIADADISLGADKYPTRHFIPTEWIANCGVAVRGILLTGGGWSNLGALGIRVAFPLPKIVDKIVKLFCLSTKGRSICAGIFADPD